MRVIYKYELKIDNINTIIMPAEHVILKVAEQDGKLFFWAEVDTSTEEIGKIFMIYGTGQELSHGGYEYFDSVIMSNGLVWHIYA